MYRTVVTIYIAQWSLYVPYSGHYMYHTVVTICTTSLTFNNSTFCPHNIFMCFVWIWEQTAIISLYNINWPVFITEKRCVYCAVRIGCLSVIRVDFVSESLMPFLALFTDRLSLVITVISEVVLRIPGSRPPTPAAKHTLISEPKMYPSIYWNSANLTVKNWKRQ